VRTVTIKQDIYQLTHIILPVLLCWEDYIRAIKFNNLTNLANFKNKNLSSFYKIIHQITGKYLTNLNI
jgi:hypothetical protein